jgi:hypothetical protein
VKSYGVSLTAGGTVGPFIGGSVSRAEYDQIDATTVFGLAGGYAIDFTPTKAVQFCPLVSFGYVSGQDFDVGFGRVSTSAHAFGVGGSIGRTVPASPDFDFIPFAGLSYILSRTSATLNGSSQSDSQDSWEIEAGAGFVMSRRFTLQPSISIPIGINGAKPTYQLTVGFNFGSSSPRR